MSLQPTPFECDLVTQKFHLNMPSSKAQKRANMIKWSVLLLKM